MSNKDNSVYQKHLTFLERENIEKFLKDGFKFYQIGNKLQKDPSTISKEIKRNYTEHIRKIFMLFFYLFWYGIYKICIK